MEMVHIRKTRRHFPGVKIIIYIDILTMLFGLPAYCAFFYTKAGVFYA